MPHAYPIGAGPASATSGHLQEERDGAVVDQLDGHVRAEGPALRAQPRAEALVERLGLLGARGGDVGRTVPAPGVAVERELADHDDLAVVQRLVHATARV